MPALELTIGLTTADRASFFTALADALAGRIPAVADDLAALAGAGRDARTIWRRLWRSLAAFDAPLSLTLVDPHGLVGPGSEVYDGLRAAARAQPADVRVAIVAGPVGPASADEAAPDWRGMAIAGRWEAIERAIAAMPAERVAGEPTLLFWRARAAVGRGMHELAERGFASALAAARAAGDADVEVGALVGLAALALWSGRRAEMAARLEEAEPALGRADETARGQFWLARGAERHGAGDSAGMRAAWERVLAEVQAEDAMRADLRTMALGNLATWAIERGWLERAERWALQAEATAATWRLPRRARGIACRLEEIRLLMGAPEAGALPERLPPGWDESLDWADRGYGWSTLARAHLARGTPAEADACFRRAAQAYARAGFPAGEDPSLEHRLAALLARGQAARVVGLAAELDLPTGEDASIWALAAALPLARAQLALGRAAEAAATAARLRRAFRAREAALYQARAALIEAAAVAAIGGSSDALAEAEALIAAHGYEFLRTRDGELWAMLRAATPAATLVVRAFGPLEVRADGLVLERWPRRKAKLVLALLLLHPRGLDASALAESLSEEGEERHDVHVAVSALRRALEPGLPRGGRSRWVEAVDGRYRLAPAVIEGADLTGFERAWRAFEGARERDGEAAIAAAERGLALHQGPLFADALFAGRFEAERERCRRQALALALWLGDRRWRDARPAEAEAAFARALALAPGDEEAALAAMRFWTARGKPERVRAIYWDCRKARRQRLGLTTSEGFERAARTLVDLT